MIRMSIDPGVSGTGWALWNESMLLKCGTLHYKYTAEEWLQKARQICFEFERIFRGEMVEEFVFEYPVFMRGYGGYTTASTGSLIKLAVLTGMLISLAMESKMADVVLVEPSQWKGQLPKKVCENRIRKILPNLARKHSNHAIDAIGLGLWRAGLFK